MGRWGWLHNKRLENEFSASLKPFFFLIGHEQRVLRLTVVTEKSISNLVIQVYFLPLLKFPWKNN